ncbi:hypothetical protein O3M35_011112 [Rhynocoris fuscipes]|uniref:Uncharacterized protein n=1 Tax=Rhynocoris fuscipes TaxID=488301 RepID=A0AAW1CXB0_9HEMI
MYQGGGGFVRVTHKTNESKKPETNHRLRWGWDVAKMEAERVTEKTYLMAITLEKEEDDKDIEADGGMR